MVTTIRSYSFIHEPLFFSGVCVCGGGGGGGAYLAYSTVLLQYLMSPDDRSTISYHKDIGHWAQLDCQTVMPQLADFDSMATIAVKG